MNLCLHYDKEKEQAKKEEALVWPGLAFPPQQQHTASIDSINVSKDLTPHPKYSGIIINVSKDLTPSVYSGIIILAAVYINMTSHR